MSLVDDEYCIVVSAVKDIINPSLENPSERKEATIIYPPLNPGAKIGKCASENGNCDNRNYC